jgi:DNA-binding NarL/FixJ family response regulator
MTKPKRPLILIVDDEPAHRLLAKRVMMRSYPEAKLMECQNLDQARIEIKKHISLDLALIDFNLGLECGADLAIELRKSHSVEQLPVIVISTSSLAEDVERSYTAGASCFIVKEPDAGQYQECLRKAVNFFLPTQSGDI